MSFSAIDSSFFFRVIKKGFFFLLSNQKDHIEFVIPSTKPPNWNGSASRSLYCQSSTKSFSTESNPTDQQKSYSSQQNPKNYPENLAEETGSVVNKGWNFISSAFTASSNFKTIGSKFENSQQRARSRDSLFPANHNSLQGSLDIPSIKTRSGKNGIIFFNLKFS